MQSMRLKAQGGKLGGKKMESYRLSGTTREREDKITGTATRASLLMTSDGKGGGPMSAEDLIWGGFG